MHEIFISYRRIDTEASAGHLYSDLRRSFGEDSVFMDTRGGSIPWGADWDKSLTTALQNCEVLIAPIGRQWVSCERSPGCRRLDAADDWVRAEIAAALRRSVPVLPVLFDGISPPQEAELPGELRALNFAKKQGKSVSETNWDADVDQLIGELVKVPRLKELHDLATTQTGIRLLEDLIGSNPAVADAVARSREVIESTEHEIGELKLLKGVHDGLHTIEAECLVPMRVDTSTERLSASRFDFAVPSAAIRAVAEAQRPADPLLTDLVDRLELIAAKFERAEQPGTGCGRDAVLSELEELISFFPDQLHDLIARAATRLRLDRLMQLMATVRAVLPPTAAEDSELKPFFETIGALEGLRNRLSRLVREHGVLQGLDLKLRRVCVGMRATDIPAGGKALAVGFEWAQIERQRARLAPPLSPELQQAGIARLEQLELQIRAIVERGDDRAASGMFERYFHAVGVVFQALDTSLKNFCSDLDRESQGLRTILRQVESRHG